MNYVSSVMPMNVFLSRWMLAPLHVRMMLANGITKTNIARTLSMRPQNLLERYPDIENLADAQDRADETGEPQEVHLAKTNTVQVVTKRHA